MNEEQLRKEWLERRRQGVGASDSPKIVLGEVFGQTALDVYRDKMGVGVEVNPDNPDIRRGTMLEHIPVDMFTKDTGAKVVRPMTLEERYKGFWHQHQDMPFMYANLDAYVEDPKKALVEVKCPRMGGFMAAKNSGLSDYYQIQGQHQMAVTGAKVVHFLIFSAELWEYVHIPLSRDEEMIGIIIDKVTRFWKENVEAGVPPEVGLMTANAPTMSSKGAKFDDVSGSEAWREAVETFVKYDDDEKAAKTAKEEAREVIGELMRFAKKSAVMMDGHKFTLVDSTSTSFDKAALAAAHPEIDLDKFTTVKSAGQKVYVTLSKKRKETGK